MSRGEKKEMRVHFEEPDIQIQEFEYEDTLHSEGKSLSQFCQFVEYYTRHSTEALCTDAIWAKAEEVQITPHDVSPETIYLLIETMLVAIEHLEKKWLDKQIQFEDPKQRRKRNREQGDTYNHLKHMVQTWMRRVQNRFVQNWQLIIAGPTL